MISDFVAELRSINDVETLVGNANIQPMVNKTKAERVIVYNVSNNFAEAFTTDSFAPIKANIQLDVYTRDYAELQTLKQSIINKFNNFRGPINNSIYIITASNVNTVIETVDSEDTQVFRTMIDLELYYN